MFEQINTITTRTSNAINDTINDRFPEGFGESLTDSLTGGFTETSDRVLDTVVDVNRRVVDFAVSTADRVYEQLSSDLAFVDQLPAPIEAGERYMDFVDRAVAVNREMNERVAEMLTNAAPATPKRTAQTAPAKKTTAKKSAAKKSTAKKSTAKKSTAKKSAAKKSASKKSTATA